MQVLANARVVIILQYLSISNQHIVHLKPTQCYVSYYLNKARGKKSLFHPFEKSYFIIMEHWKIYPQIHFPKTRKVMILGVYS